MPHLPTPIRVTILKNIPEVHPDNCIYWLFQRISGGFGYLCRGSEIAIKDSSDAIRDSEFTIKDSTVAIPETGALLYIL